MTELERRLDDLEAAIAADVPVETLEAEHAAIGRLFGPTLADIDELHAKTRELDERIARGISSGSVVMPSGRR